MTSFFGQGACQAIEDATELANALLTHYSSSTPSAETLNAAFVDYSETRGKRGKDLVSFSSVYAGIHVARLPYGLGPIARQFLYKWLPIWCWFWALEWLYGYQPMIKEVRMSGEFAGCCN
jgi:salicylate hydroxylase